MKPSEKGLSVRLHRGQIVISIGIATLAHAIEWAPDLERHNNETGEWRHPVITKPLIFAREMVRALNQESETGVTMVHRLLDKAALEAIEQGAEGIQLPDDKPLSNPHEAKR